MNDSNKLTIILVLIVAFLLVILVGVSQKPDKPESTTPPEFIPPELSPKPPKEYTLEDAVDSITEKECKDHLYKLASDEWEGRMSGKRGNVLAAEYIKKEFEKYGLKTEYQRFNIRRYNPGPNNETGDNFTQNIYGWIEGSDPNLKDEIVVIGAHMDHIGYGPSMSRTPRRIEIHNGADDNASGTTCVLEIAEAFSMLKPKRTVMFQLYSAEEMGLIGSRYYCNNPTMPKVNPVMNKHVFMLNLDMVGYLGRGTYFASFSDGNSSIDIDRYIKNLNRKYVFADRITSRRGGGSDHASFYNKRVPVAFLHTGMHRHYHTPDDTAEKIDCHGMQEIAKYAFELAWRVANEDKAPVFNKADFREMEYIHDHGIMKFHHYHED
jgi:putative aminopeptidase FrvX